MSEPHVAYNAMPSPRTNALLDALTAEGVPLNALDASLNSINKLAYLARELECELTEARRAISDGKPAACLAEIARIADSAIKTRSRDVDDWSEDMEYILAIARGLKEPPK